MNPWAPITGPIYGVDTSGNQTMTTVRQIVEGTLVPATKFRFGIVKATEGRGFVHQTYDEQIDLYRYAEWLTGAYHFHWPTNPVEADFDNFRNTAKLKLGEIAVLDAENWDSLNGYADMKNMPKWIDRLLWDLDWLRIADEYYGARPWIYLNWDWIKNFRIAAGMVNPDGTIKTTATGLWEELTSYPLFLASYSGVGGQHATVDGGWKAGIVCHQFTDKPIDQNYMASSTPHEVWWASGAKKGITA